MGKKLKTSSKKISKKKYEKELYKLQIELCRLQEWVVKSGARVIVVFEGRDAAGKGGAAELLNLKPSTLRFRMKKLGIQRA